MQRFYENKHLAVVISKDKRGIAQTPHITHMMKHGFTKDIKYSKTKSQANKFANDYMKKHDTC